MGSVITVGAWIQAMLENGGYMLKRLPYLIALLFLAVTVRASPPMGAVVQTWHYDPQSSAVTVSIVNTSHKDITAYNISIKETYADGHANSHELLCEYAG